MLTVVIDNPESAREKAEKILAFYEGVGRHNTCLSVNEPATFDALRLMIVEGRLDADDVRFEFNGEQVVVNRYGAVKDWPEGFLDEHMGILDSILRKSVEMRKRERDVAAMTGGNNTSI